MVLTAQTRYDVGFYFASDGDPNNDGAITGAVFGYQVHGHEQQRTSSSSTRRAPETVRRHRRC